MYLPTSWFLWESMAVVVRTSTDPAALAPVLRTAVAHADPAQAVYDIRTMQSVIATSTAEPRLNAALLGAFATLALLLASVGVAGVVSYGVARRTPELAVRLALGASPGHTVRLVMTGALTLCVTGILGGAIVAVALSRLLGGLLFGVSTLDPWTYLLSATALLTVSIVACWLPARRVARISPCLALRGD
jgi:putative ABC transport system permease protein